MKALAKIVQRLKRQGWDKVTAEVGKAAGNGILVTVRTETSYADVPKAVCSGTATLAINLICGTLLCSREIYGRPYSQWGLELVNELEAEFKASKAS